MPIHNWTRVFAGAFHDFHIEWITAIKHALNDGVLPAGFYAMAEQITGKREQDVLTLRPPSAPSSCQHEGDEADRGGIAVAVAPPKTRFHVKSEGQRYAEKARAVVIRHRSEHQVVALIELVSPGNKSSERDLSAFVKKARDFTDAGVHMLIADLFPPTSRDPQGIHPAIWGADTGGDEFQFSPAKPLTCVSYRAGVVREAYIEPVAVGDPLPDMPIFLDEETYVSVPLELTYQTAFRHVPPIWRDALTA